MYYVAYGKPILLEYKNILVILDFNEVFLPKFKRTLHILPVLISTHS